MEIFIFVEMNAPMAGKQDSMIVKPLTDDDDLYSRLSNFNAGNAQCFLPQDRDRLCARDTGCDTRATPSTQSPNYAC